MAVARIPLIGTVTSRDPTRIWVAGQPDQLYENCVFRVIKDESTRSMRIRVRPASALSAVASPGGSGQNRAVLVWLGSSDGDNIINARGDTNSEIFEDTTSRGSITGLVRFFSETTISGTANVVAISDNASGRTWYWNGSALTEITSTNFPPKQTPALTITGNAVHMDGYMFVMCTNGDIWNSDLNSLSAWSATSKITANRSPDAGVGLARMQDLIVAFGKGTTEFYRNVGYPSGSPLSRITDATINIGAINQFAIVPFNGSVAFIGVSKDRSTGVYLLEGTQAKKISDDVVDEFISSLAVDALALCIWADGGKAMLGIRHQTPAAKALLYDSEAGIWSQWSGGVFINATDIRLSPTGSVGSYAVVASSDGSVYRVGPPTYSGNTCLAMTVQTSRNDMGTRNRKTWHSVKLIGDGVGQGAATAVVTLSSSIDGGLNFTSNGNLVSTAYDPVVRRLGMSRDVTWKLATTANSFSTTNNAWMDSLEVEYTVNAT